MTGLAGLDLNLLRVFDAVARARHVTRAAERLNLSQPAVSNALARLRVALHDELFLRRPGGVEPTALALTLAGPIAEALDRLAETLSVQAPFVPASASRVFPLAMSEYAEAVLAPPLLAAVARQAPGCMVAISHADRTNAMGLLEAGQAQLAIGVLAEPTALYTRLRLLPEGFRVLMRPDHPLAEGVLDVARYLGVPHLLHSPNGSRDGAVDGELAKTGRQRRLGAVVAHLSAVPAILHGTDMIMTLSSRLAEMLGRSNGLVCRESPLSIRHVRLSLVFHRRFEADSGHVWLRQLLLQLARAVKP